MFNLVAMKFYIMYQYSILLLYLYTFASFNDFFIFEKNNKYEIDKSKILFIYYIVL